jgi:GNAT superfamily N-acetyltransferase
MTIREIILMPSRVDYIEKYVHIFTNAHRVPAFNNLTFAEVKDTDVHFLGLFNDAQLISFLHLEIRTYPYFQVTYSQTEPEFQRQGCFRFLLEKAVDTHSHVLSDNRQTTEATAAWKSLIQYPGGRMHFYLFNGTTIDKLPLEYKTIWNNEELPLVIASKIQYTVEQLQRSKHDDERRMKYNRHRNYIWFGPNSSTPEYTNP